MKSFMNMSRILFTPFLAMCLWFGPAAAQLGANHKLAIEISECGLNYVTASKRLANRVVLDPFTQEYQPVSLPAAVQLTGIPECAPIEKAYIWWDMAGGSNNQTIQVEDPNGNTQSYPGTLIGNDASSKCWWGYNRTRTFRAEISPTITGNGTYKVSGVPQAAANGQGNADTDGFTIMVFYKDPTATYEGHVVIWDGGDIVDSKPFQEETGKTSQTMTGLSICGSTSAAESFMIVADMQYNDRKAKISMNNGQEREMTAAFWNFEKDNATISQSQTSSKFTVESGGYLRPADNKWVLPADCYSFVMMGLYYQTTTCKTCTPQPAAEPIVLDPQKTEPTCGGQPGNITVNARGGNGTFEYTWSPPVSTGSSASNLEAGTYHVTVKSGCEEENISVTLAPSGNLIAETSLMYEDGCDRWGGSLANATVAPTGGTAPYSYQWDDPQQQTTAIAVGLAKGNYTVTITDAGGCGMSQDVEIPNKIVVDLNVENVPCTGCADGKITGLVSGFGTPPFTYRWNDVNEQTTLTANGLTPGTYVLIVTDSAGCFNSDTVSIGVTGIENRFLADELLAIYPNPNKGEFSIKLNEPIEGELSIHNQLGEAVYHQKLNNRLFNIRLDQSAGIYYVHIKTNSGVLTRKILITDS